jgi:DNA-binding LytR/AlgR family response regulator
MAELDEDLFFRISRNYYISFHSIRGIEKRPDGRLDIQVEPSTGEPLQVSRQRVKAFLDWIS